MAYDNIYKKSNTGGYYSIVNGTAREFTDQQAAAALAPNAQVLEWGTNTAGYDPRYGGGTTGGAWDTQSFINQTNFQTQNAAVNQAAEQKAAQSNAQVAAAPTVASTVAPTDFQKYFQGEIAKGRAAGDILASNPFMAGQAQGPAAQQPMQAAAQPQAAAPVVSPATTYAGNSIVDYLKSAGKATDFTSRSKMAAEQGITNYSGTAEQNLQLLNKLRTSSAPAAKPAGTITADSFKNVTSITTPAPTGNPQADADAVADSVGKQGASQIEQFIAMLNPPETENQKLEKSVLDRMAGIVAKSGDRSADQLQAEKDAGIEQKTNDLNAVLGEIKMKEAEYNAYKLAQEGKPITLASISGSIAEKRNQIASEMLLLQGKADILQGNLASAQSRVDRAIDLRYDSLDQEYKILGAQLAALEPTLNREEKQTAMAQQLLLQERQQALQDKKDTEKSIQALVLEAAKNGASSSVLNQMTKATDFMSAVQIGASYLQADKKQQDFENQVTLKKLALDEASTNAQIMNINSEIQKRGLEGEGYDPNEILAYVQQYASTGVVPTGMPKGSFGVISEAAKELPQQKGALVNAITGVKDSKLGVTEQSDLTRLYNITENVKELAELDKQRIGGVIGGTLGKIFGSDAQAEYLTKRQAIVDDIQRMQSGAALSETEQKFYSDYLPGRLSESFFLGQGSDKTIQNFANEMNSKLQNALATNGLSIYGYSKVNIGGKEYTVGDTLEANGQKGVVLPDGNISVQDFNSESQTSSKGTAMKLAAIPNNIDGGQCGRFVNQLTGLGVGDSYKSKLAKMDPTIKTPEPGMVFTMPYKDTGHIGFIIDVKDGIATVKDSNWYVNTAPEQVRTHKIPVSEMTGFKRVNITA